MMTMAMVAVMTMMMTLDDDKNDFPTVVHVLPLALPLLSHIELRAYSLGLLPQHVARGFNYGDRLPRTRYSVRSHSLLNTVS